MVYAEGDNCLYAYSDWIIIPHELSSLEMGMYHYCIEFDTLPDAPDNTPEGAFERVWHRYEEDAGRASAHPSGQWCVTRRRPGLGPGDHGRRVQPGIITLPDGRSLSCGTRAATAGRCDLHD